MHPTGSMRKRPGARLLVALTISCLAIACTEFDTQETYDEYLDARDVTPSGDLDVVGETCDFSGDYFMAVQTPLGGPILFTTTIVATDGEAGWVIDLTLQPLKTDITEDGDPREDARAPTGPPIPITDIPCEEGEFSFSIDGLTVPGDADPVLVGIEIVADMIFDGRVLSADEFCGAASGQLITPAEADLTGTTFGATLTEDPTTAEVVIACP